MPVVHFTHVSFDMALFLAILLPSTDSHGQDPGRCRAYATVAKLPLKIEQYNGTPYFFLGNGDLEFTITATPRPTDAIDLLWGSKRDQRTALVTVNGKTSEISAGGYDGYRWIRVDLPFEPGSKLYRATLSRSGGKAAFIAAIRLASNQRAPDATFGPSSESHHINFRLPRLQNGWPAVESFAGYSVLERNGLQARRALLQSHRFTTGWLSNVDPHSGLIPENFSKGLDRWNGRNNGADNYPFMVLTAALTDRSLFEGRLLDMLQTEERLTSRVDRLGDVYKFSIRGFEYGSVDVDRIIFDNSEYVKDGLMPLTEWLGPSPWSQRMSGIIEDIWKHAPVATPLGKIPSVNPEVNGEMMQLTSRYFWMTGQRQYLDQAIRIADWYLLGDRHPTNNAESIRLRDHGCELISGLTEVYFACSYSDKQKAKQYRAPLFQLLDCVLKYGIDDNGMMVNVFNPQTGKVVGTGLSDTWGYNYNGFYTVFLVDAVERYRDAVRHALSNLNKYEGYAWEGQSHDGYADSIESAINLYNREPIEVASSWIDSQMRIMLAMQRDDGIIGGWHGDGNFARTAIMYALWKQQGVTIQPWRSDIRLGAVQEDGTLRLLLAADRPWDGRLVFDSQRHKTIMHMPQDYPRINQFPEWFTVDAKRQYEVVVGEASVRLLPGRQLLDGLPARIAPDSGPVRLTVRSSEH